MRPTVTSLQNQQVKHLVKLRQRRRRDRAQQMLIDGARALTMALVNHFPIDTLYYDVDRADETLLERAVVGGIALQPVTPIVFQKIGYGQHPDGHLGLAAQPPLSLADLPRPENPLYVITEGLEKPGNLGAILRSADAAGVTGLIVCHSRDGANQTDIFNPNVIRASRGAFFSVPMAVARSDVALCWLQENEVGILAATPIAPQAYTETPMDQPLALALGSEHAGLTAPWLEHTQVRIPMAGQVDSLNVAQTATLLMYEAVRQRRRKD